MSSTLSTLTQLVRGTLASGSSIAVLGVRNHSHDQEIKKLSGKRVMLYGSTPPTGIGPTVGLILHTNQVDHSDTNRIRNGAVIYKPSINIRLVKQALESCADLLAPPPCSHPANKAPEPVPKPVAVEQVAQPPPRTEPDEEVLDFMITPRMERTMSNMERFTELFLEEAKKDSDGCVGKMVLSRLRQECGVGGETRKQTRDGWLEPVKRAGTSKVGRYRAGRMMTGNSQREEFEPSDKLELAKFLVAKKPKVLEQQAAIEKELARIAVAERVLAQLDEVQ